MAQDRVQVLIGRLRDFRARKAAADGLVAAGREAVGPLMEALRAEAVQGARWAILKCLGELRAPQAVPAIAPFLDQSDYQTVAHEALVAIAGKDLGPLPADWLRWAERRALETGQPIEADAGPLDDAGLVKLALAEGCATCREEEPGRHAVSLPLAGGVTQRVTVVFGATDREGSQIVIVYSDCGEASREHYETALRLNMRMPYGAVALRDIGGKPHFVVFNTILRQALTPIELRKTVFTVGEAANRVARELRR